MRSAQIPLVKHENWAYHIYLRPWINPVSNQLEPIDTMTTLGATGQKTVYRTPVYPFGRRAKPGLLVTLRQTRGPHGNILMRIHEGD
ncbi:MAG: hypothetical protein RIQ72_448 [Candidatus Parcubacteria bacterium]|jgi:hypothetical protein